MITKCQDEISDHHSTDHSVLWERDIALYVWQESPNDVSRADSCTAPHQQESGLALKACACTPAVQRYNGKCDMIMCIC